MSFKKRKGTIGAEKKRANRRFRADGGDGRGTFFGRRGMSFESMVSRIEMEMG
jgi:hypothetical protein